MSGWLVLLESVLNIAGQRRTDQCRVVRGVHVRANSGSHAGDHTNGQIVPTGHKPKPKHRDSQQNMLDGGSRDLPP